ncbi:MAG TPA: molybdate ABC transporter substrate-binding protein [Rugosibacter sp.]|nr:molybdate ABC transporter substrate-binding protein [Rugosibacter sp.]HQN45847.1 molybdate ABC transporter substrate-binding protein [Rugosibacter sp.]HQQ35361.1 molybdate ABC transporter substrate-binding protein [Rugosibacter sp.]
MAQADAVSVAVAANFSGPMKRINAEFEKTSGHKVALSFGSTGKFYAQVKAGAPFEVLLAADDETPGKMAQEGLAVKGSRFTYAIGKLVLWSAKEAIVDGNGDILKRGRFEHLAVANPKLAPYGAAGVQTLQALGVYDAIAPKLVQGENIAQTYQFIATGNALLGFIALSQVIGGDGKAKSGSAWIVPEKYYTPIRQDAVLLAKGKDNTAAVELLKFLKTSDAARIIQSYGYGLPK